MLYKHIKTTENRQMYLRLPLWNTQRPFQKASKISRSRFATKGHKSVESKKYQHGGDKTESRLNTKVSFSGLLLWPSEAFIYRSKISYPGGAPSTPPHLQLGDRSPAQWSVETQFSSHGRITWIMLCFLFFFSEAYLKTRYVILECKFDIQNMSWTTNTQFTQG